MSSALRRRFSDEPKDEGWDSMTRRDKYAKVEKYKKHKTQIRKCEDAC